MSDLVQAVEALVKKLGDERDADIMVYFGTIDRDGSDRILQLLKSRKRRKNLILMLATFGGDANAAYRIARALQQAYGIKKGYKSPADPWFSIFVPTWCKSAGTILALGADDLLISDEAELGPIDVQLRKEDEIGERTSGLTPTQAIQNLQRQVDGVFKGCFKKLRFDDDLGFSTKMAAEIASGLTIGVMTPIFAQIDPVRLAEVERLMRISSEYGRRIALNNLKDETSLSRLLGDYPSHGFVIDRQEAAEIFKNVAAPNSDLVRLAELFDSIYKSHLDGSVSFIYYISNEPVPPPEPPAPTPQAPREEVTDDLPADEAAPSTEATATGRSAATANGGGRKAKPPPGAQTAPTPKPTG